MPQLNLPKLLAASPLILLVLIALVLQGCFLDDDDPAPVPVPDAMPTGYYDVTGTASLGGIPNITDLQAIVNGNSIMMMSVANELLYDGTITSISGNDFTATFTIYDDGENPITATASGVITQGSSITGTLTGSGVGSGTFSLIYAISNNQVASLSRIENTTNATWGALVGGSTATAAFEFIIDAMGGMVDDVNNVQGLFHPCQIALISTISPIADTNLYEINAELVGCANTNVSTNYTGLATTRTQSNADDTLVFMMTSGAYSFSSDFQ